MIVPYEGGIVKANRRKSNFGKEKSKFGERLFLVFDKDEKTTDLSRSVVLWGGGDQLGDGKNFYWCDKGNSANTNVYSP
jgi:hypothetical protein